MKYKYNDLLEGEKTVTDKEIIEEYFPYWSERMKEAGQEDKVSPENCIADFVITHYAWEYYEE